MTESSGCSTAKNQAANRITDDQFRTVGEALLAHRSPLLVSHERPDPDALGCLLGMHSILASLGKNPTAVLYDQCPRRYRFLPGADRLVIWSDIASIVNCDSILVLDTCASQQISPIVEFYRKSAVPKFVVDHHITRDLPVDHRLIDESAAAASLIVHRWATTMNWTISQPAAAALLAGVIGDTGWFRFDNTDASTLRTAGDLLDLGVDLDWLHQNLHQSEPASTLRLRAAALGAMRFHRGDSIAIIPIASATFDDCGADRSDGENLVNEPLSVKSVRASVLLVEMPDGLIKCSFRSKGDIDVAAIARGFGGGGHARAAGARIEGTIENVEQLVVDRLTQALDA